MKKIFRFNRGFVPAFIASGAVILFGLFGFFTKGFNLGVDFQAGVNETVQLAYPALEVTYSGKGNAVLTVAEDKATIVFSGAEADARTVVVDYKSAPTLGALAGALSAVPEIGVKLLDAEGVSSSLMVPTYQGNTSLGPEPVTAHRSPAGEAERFADIAKVNASLKGLAEATVVTPAGAQRFLVRAQDDGKVANFSKTAPDSIKAALEKEFGQGRVVVVKTDYVGARYSDTLSRQAFWLFVLTALVILVYATLRFGFQYGFGAVLATFHDALIMICFVVWTRMEFTTSTIAALLTILGYSINDTIVQFDRVREDRRLNPGDRFVDVLNRALSETLSRTIITTLCTMITVLSIFFFTSGSLKDFALVLFVGMISGTYSTLYIASGFVHWWEKRAEAKRAKTLALEAERGYAAAVAKKTPAKQ